jgi:hypothetical protein
MRQTMSAPEAHTVFDLLPYLASIPVLGGWATIAIMRRNKIKALEERIIAASVETAELIKADASIRKEIASCQLTIAEKHATNSFVQEVEMRLTKRLETFESNLMTAVRGRDGK